MKFRDHFINISIRKSYLRFSSYKTYILNYKFKNADIELHHTGSIYDEKQKALIIPNFEFYQSSISEDKRLADFGKLKKIIQLEACIKNYEPQQIIFLGGLRFHINEALENLKEFKSKFEKSHFFYISSQENAFLEDFKHIGIECLNELNLEDFKLTYQKEKTDETVIFPADNFVEIDQENLPCFCETKTGFSLPTFATNNASNKIEAKDYQSVFAIKNDQILSDH
ncbi:hypothetical protein CAP47_01325 [Psychroflexus sp. S27]|nr:hypothetical protein CAP47_01325 [Psychroflexus sp. S27]